MAFFSKSEKGKGKTGQKRQRVEPSFEPSAQTGGGDLRLSIEDRAVATGRSSTRQSASKPANRKPQARSAKPKATKRKPQQNSGSFVWRMTKGAVYWSFVLGIWGTLGVAGIVGYYAAQLPQLSTWQVPERPPNAKIVSVDGELLANRGFTGGEAMLLDDMSPYIPMAVIAIEDRRFQSHFGFDPIGFTRAMVSNVMAGRLVQGGSTLTQQLAKNLFLKPERTFERKVQELVLAFWLETKFTKDEILELYLNRVYFGSGAYGVDAASRRYFNKSARDVNLAEAALLAGLLKAPSYLSPAKNPKRAEERAQVVIGAMRREGFVTDRETARALSTKAQKAKRYWSGSEHYAADLVMKEIETILGEIGRDVLVDTTIDMDLQKIGGKLVRETLDQSGAKLNVSQGALVSIDGTGAVRALIGGREYADSQFNRASDAKRQPGSAFKPFVYLAALETGLSPDSQRLDAPIRIGKWKPENYDSKYRGEVTLDTAITKSLNTIAAQLAMEVGPKSVTETAYRLGIRSDLKRNASIALGTSEVSLLELTSAYAPFANGGYSVQPYLIRRIRDAATGEVLYERKGPPSDRVVSSRELGMMNVMLRHVVEKGTAKKAKLKGWQVAGKTGTSQNFRDALFVGYTANLITGVWYGNDDGKPTRKVTGGSIPAETFAAFMANAHEGVPVAELPGNYVPQYAVIPQPRPGRVQPRPSREITGTTQAAEVERRQLQRGVRPDEQVSSARPQVRRPLSDVDPSARREKPKSILDLLFGG